MIFTRPYRRSLNEYRVGVTPDGSLGQNGYVEMFGQHVATLGDRRADQAVEITAPIDRGHLARYTLGDRELELEVLALFAGQAGKCLGEMAMVRTPKDWKETAHGLKGSARAVGAWDVANLAASAEAMDGDNPIHRSAVLDALGVALSATTRYIAEIGRTGSPS